MKIEVRSAPHRRVSVADILPNPHRDLKANPVSPEKIADLIDSISRTGFWDNIVVRAHPSREGKYQLAYGHNRLAALKDRRVEVDDITIPVAKLSDWDMYCAMVDENETQGTMTPAVAFENIGVGCDLIEAAMKKIGPSGTWEDFNEALDRRAVPAGTARKPDGHGFEQTRNRFFAEEGLGRSFLEEFLPCGAMRHTTISEVTLSRYGSLRQKAKAKEAEATRKAAAAAKDSAEAARLRKKAGELEVLAKKIGKGAIARDVLLQFETPRMMSDFGQAIRALGIPKEHHEAAAREILQAAVHGSAIKPKLDLWWDVRSGAAGKRLAAAERDQRMAKLRRMVHGGDINAFLVKLDADLGNMLRDLKIAADAAHFANANIRNRIVRQWPQYADLIALIVTRAGATSSEIIDVTPSKLLTHQEEAVA